MLPSDVRIGFPEDMGHEDVEKETLNPATTHAGPAQTLSPFGSSNITRIDAPFQ